MRKLSCIKITKQINSQSQFISLISSSPSSRNQIIDLDHFVAHVTRWSNDVFMQANDIFCYSNEFSAGNRLGDCSESQLLCLYARIPGGCVNSKQFWILFVEYLRVFLAQRTCCICPLGFNTCVNNVYTVIL